MNISIKNGDPLGVAVSDYYSTSQEANIIVESDLADNDVIPVSYLFRKVSDMPRIEQQALKLCKGKVLDVGAAAGCHSLVLQKRGVDVYALDISVLCCEVMRKRGITNVIHMDFYRYENKKYDTLLFLMNGIGIAGTIQHLDKFLKKADSLLNTGGLMIFDSSDIAYLYIEEDGSEWINLNNSYYGELSYTLHYKSITSQPFPWLFIDFNTLAPIAKRNGFEPQLVAGGDHYDYLGILKKI